MSAININVFRQLFVRPHSALLQLHTLQSNTKHHRLPRRDCWWHYQLPTVLPSTRFPAERWFVGKSVLTRHNCKHQASPDLPPSPCRPAQQQRCLFTLLSVAKTATRGWARKSVVQWINLFTYCCHDENLMTVLLPFFPSQVH